MTVTGNKINLCQKKKDMEDMKYFYDNKHIKQAAHSEHLKFLLSEENWENVITRLIMFVYIKNKEHVMNKLVKCLNRKHTSKTTSHVYRFLFSCLNYCATQSQFKPSFHVSTLAAKFSQNINKTLNNQNY